MNLSSLFPLHFSSPTAWLVVGFIAQGFFAARFLVQWLASERARRSVIPEAFWHLSVFGGMLLLFYAIHRRDPVFILGQVSGVFIYTRNLWLLHVDKHDGCRLAP